MKKFLSVLLTFSMLLTFLIVPISADGDTAQNEDTFVPVDLGTKEDPENTTVVEGVEYYTDADEVQYIVIRDAAGFKAMTGTNNYILANDISLDDYVVTGVDTGYVTGWYGILDGNGKSITDFSVAGNAVGLFFFNDDNKDVTIKNITFGSEENMITGGGTGASGNAVISGQVRIKSLTLIKCNAFVDFESNNNLNAAFIGHDFTGNTTYIFRECNAYGTIKSAQKTGGFIGNTRKPGVNLQFYDCENHVDVTGTNQGVGGFFGGSNQDNTSIYFENCRNYGDITTTVADQPVGGLIGQVMHANVTCTFIDSANSGTLTGKNVNAYTGGYIGYTAAPGKITASNSDSNFVAENLIGAFCDLSNSLAMSDLYATKTTRGNIYFSTTINGLQTLNADTQAYYQTRDAGENLKDVRVLISVPEAGIASVQGINIEVTFGLTAGGAKTLNVSDMDEKLASYYSVIADTKIAEAGENYVLLAVVVTGVDTTAWNGTVQVEMTATDAEGNLVEGFQITPAGDAEAGNP